MATCSAAMTTRCRGDSVQSLIESEGSVQTDKQDAAAKADTAALLGAGLCCGAEQGRAVFSSYYCAAQVGACQLTLPTDNHPSLCVVARGLRQMLGPADPCPRCPWGGGGGDFLRPHVWSRPREAHVLGNSGGAPALCVLRDRRPAKAPPPRHLPPRHCSRGGGGVNWLGARCLWRRVCKRRHASKP